MSRPGLLVAGAAMTLAILAAVLARTRPSAEADPRTRTAEDRAFDPVPPTPLDSLLGEAEALYWDGRFEASRTLWRQARERARRAGDVGTEAIALTWLGLAAWRLGMPEEARRLGERALSLKLEHGLTSTLARSYNALGLLAWSEGRLAEAADLFEKTTHAARAAGDRATEAKAANNSALVHTDLGEFDEARRNYRGSLSAAREIADTLIQGRVLSNLGMLETRVGNPEAGLRLLEEARTLYHASGDPTGEQHTLGQLGVAYAALDRPRLAFAVLDSALAQARRHELRQEEASDLELIGELYRRAGEHQRALEFYQRARAIYADLGLEIERGSILRSLARAHLALRNLTEARDFAEEALSIHEASGARIEALADRLVLVSLSQARGDRREALHHLAAAANLAETLDSRAARAALALSRARLAVDADEPLRALEVLRAALAVIEGGTFRELAEAEWLRARALRRRGHLQEAIAAGRRAVTAVENVRETFGSGLLRTSFSFDVRDVYADLVESLLAQDSVRQAFEVADAARGRSLLERLVARDEVRPVRGTSREEEHLLRRIGDLALRIEELEALEAGERDPSIAAAREALTAALTEARRAFEEIRIRRAEITDRATLLGTADVSAGEIQAHLEPGELLVEYFLAPDRLHIFLADREDVRHISADVEPGDLAARIRVLRDIIAGSPSEPPRILDVLHRTLVGPIEDRLAARGPGRLIVVPDGPLVDVPFAALRDGRGTYLVEKHALLHLPAAGMLPTLRAGVPGGETGSAAPVHVLAPFPERLPFTRREARELEELLPGTSIRIGSSATEALARRTLAKGAVVHVAGHATLDPVSPLFSRVRFSRGSGDPDDDGRLEVHELLDTPIRSPLVFLSGCETGAGAAWTTLFDRGEDFATLARGFLFAGARNVVATRWRIEDQGAAAFAARFYRHLRAHPPVEALALAQRESIRDPRYAAPYYWAGYRIVGDGEEVTAHNESNIPFLNGWWERLRKITSRSGR